MPSTPPNGMVGQDREEANRLQQAKWELTSRIRDESNVPNAFHFSRRSRKRYSAEPPQQRLRDDAGGVRPEYRRVAWAIVGLKRLRRRQLAFVGPPQAMLFYELPGLVDLTVLPVHRHLSLPQSSSGSRFTVAAVACS